MVYSRRAATILTATTFQSNALIVEMVFSERKNIFTNVQTRVALFRQKSVHLAKMGIWLEDTKTDFSTGAAIFLGVDTLGDLTPRPLFLH
jgi:hypothetical protein